MIKRGTYNIPFEFSLPSSLPSSTQYPFKRRGEYNCRIQYALVARLGSFSMTRIITVAACPLPSEIVPCMVRPTTQEIRSFGVLSNGHLSMGACVDNAHIGRGQTLRVSMASRNDAVVAIERVCLKLVELIQYHAIGEERQSKVTLFEVKDIDLPSLFKERGKSSRSEIWRDKRRGGRSSGNHSMEATYQAIYEDLVSRQNQFELVIPEVARDSYRGKLLTVSHYLKVTFFTKALAENPSTKIPIIIGNPPISPNHHHQQQQPHYLDTPVTPSMHIAVPVGDDCSTWDPDSGETPTRAPMVNAILLDQNSNMVEHVQVEPTGQDHNHVPPSAPDETIVLESSAVFLEHENGNLTGGVMGDRHFDNIEDEIVVEVVEHHDNDDNENEIVVETVGRRRGGGRRVQSSQQAPSIGRLFQELDDGMNDLQVFLIKEHQPEWVTRFEELTINEYGAILSHVVMDYQIRVARLLAKYIERGNGFSCAYCVAAVRNTSEHFRSNMVEALLPLCYDLDQNHLLIRNSLTEWELLITERAIEDAIR